MFMRRILGKGVDIRIGGFSNALILHENVSGEVSKEQDMLDLGIIASSLLLGRSLKYNNLQDLHTDNLLQEITAKFPEEETLVDLVKEMLEQNKTTRITAGSALKHVYFN